jgi:hypothetical protein
LMGMAALMCLPPIAAALAGASPRWIGRAAILLAAVMLFSGALAFRSPSYTPARPERRSVRYVQDESTKRAWWEISGAAPASGDLSWAPVTDGPAASVRLPPLRAVAISRATSAPVVSVRPASLTSTLESRPDGALELAITIVPDEYLTVSIVLPEGVSPIESSLAGIVSRGRWTGTYIAPPPGGLRVRIAVPANAEAALGQTAVVLGTFSVPPPGSTADARPWSDSERTAWTPRSYFIVPAMPIRTPAGGD